MAEGRKVVDSRLRGGLRHRTYVYADGRVVRTIELPATVVRGFGRGRLADLMATYQRGEERRKTASARKARAQFMDSQGATARDIAETLGVTQTRVRQMLGTRKSRDEASRHTTPAWLRV